MAQSPTTIMSHILLTFTRYVSSSLVVPMLQYNGAGFHILLVFHDNDSTRDTIVIPDHRRVDIRAAVVIDFLEAAASWFELFHLRYHTITCLKSHELARRSRRTAAAGGCCSSKSKEGQHQLARRCFARLGPSNLRHRRLRRCSDCTFE